MDKFSGETVPNPGDFDPTEAVQGVRQQQAEEQRVETQQDLHRARILELLREADKQLEKIRNPVVSEFVVTERRWRPEPGWISRIRPDQFQLDSKVVGFLTYRTKYRVATAHDRQTRYRGSWLALSSFSGERSTRDGVVKLRQPSAGYVSMYLYGWDPRDVGNVTIELTDYHGRETHWRLPIYESLEEATKDISDTVEQLTKAVTQALDFVATGQPPEPFYTPPERYEH